ncbi:MAG: hypothetical protein ABIK92_07180 [Pseudomonadota bacterium]
MEEENDPEFKINFDGLRPDSIISEDKQEGKSDIHIKRLNQKITVILILFPVVTALMIMFIYFNINKKIVGVHNSGSMEVKNLSKTIDSKTAEFSALYSKLEESLEKKISAVNNMERSLKKELDKTVNRIKKETTKSVDEIKKEAKNNESKLTNSITQISQQINTAQKDIAVVTSKIKNTDNDLSLKISSINQKLNTIENDFAKFRTSISAAVSEKINSKADKEEIELAIIKEQKRFQYELSELEKNIEQKINTIKRQLYDLEHKPIKTNPSQNLPLKSENSYSKPTIKKTTPESGKIIEQDL